MSDAETAARSSLRFDGRFCVAVGVIIAAASPALADPLGVPVLLTAVAGIVSAGWGLWLLRLATTTRWVAALTGVAAVNFVAGLGLAVGALTPGGARLRLFLSGLLSLAVLWFAVTQAIIRWNVDAAA